MILATSRGKTTADVRWCLLLAIFVALILLNLCLSVSSFHTIPHRKCRAFHPSPSLQRHWFRKRASRRFSVGCSDSIAYRRPLHVAFAIGRSGADDANQIEKRDSDQEMVSHRGDETINSEGRRLQPDNNEQKSRRVSFQGSNESRADGVSVTEAAHAPFSAKCMAKGIPGGNGTGNGGLGQYNPADKLPGRKEQVLVGDPQQKREEKEMSVTSILKELSAIQEQGPQKYCVLGTRHCSYLHQRIIELLAYALVLSENHVYTSGAGGTHSATIRGALRAERPDLLTVVLPQSLAMQPKDSQDLLQGVTDIIEMPQNDKLAGRTISIDIEARTAQCCFKDIVRTILYFNFVPLRLGLDVASRICNSFLLSQTDHLISFAFHESKTVIEASREARDMDMLVTTLFLD